MTLDPRHIALNVLLFWHKASNTLDRSLEALSKDICMLDSKDRKLCNALIFGVLRKRESIDYIIDRFSNTAVKKISINLLYILRIALFQIMYMDRVPVFAAINTSVDIAKKLAGKKKAGFVNAVLRKASTGYAKTALPDPDKKQPRFISVKYSLPLWLAKRWIEKYGFKNTQELAIQIETIPPITIRTNTLKIERKALFNKIRSKVTNIQKTEFSQEGLSFSSPDVPLHELEEFKSGLFQVQDEAAQIITHFLKPGPGEKILDACAGFGGKTGHIAQLMKNSGRVVAVDTAEKKLKSLEIHMQKLGIDIVRTKTVNILKTTIKNFDFYFDRVLMDAPCTGLGVLRRNPDTKWKRSKNDIARLGAKQKKMLNAAANLVKPGGLLVYAVCSCEKEENEDVIDKFLKKREDFSIDKNFKPGRYERFITTKGFLKTYPHIKGMDGFFAARLERKI